MSKIKWDQESERKYETGVDRGVLYLKDESGKYNTGVAWNGLTSVSDSPEGAEANPLYADNIKYLNLISAENLNITIGAYTYPDEFAECDGSRSITEGVTIGQQPRKSFGFAYRTVSGNDTELNDHGYKLHLVYNCIAAPTAREYATINDSPEAIEFSWEVSTTPVEVEGYKPTASVTIDSNLAGEEAMKNIEKVLYGDESSDPRLPLPAELIQIAKGEQGSEA